MRRLLLVFLLALIPSLAFAQSNVVVNYKAIGATGATTVTPATPLPIGGGFIQTARAADFSVTNTTANEALGVAASTARICNTGATNTAYVAMGVDSSVTVTAANGFPVLAGTCVNMSAAGYTYIAAITGSSTTTLQISLGAGIASLGGGGASGGSPGGAAGGDLTGTYPNPTIKASVSLTTPVLGVATGTSLALGGATIGADALGVTGTSTFNGNITVNAASFGLSGNISGAGIIGTSGIRYKNAPATLTDTTSSGTIATAYTDVWGGNTIAASGATTITNYYGSYFKVPVQGTNVTLTNKYALGADTLGLAAGSAALPSLTFGGANRGYYDDGSNLVASVAGSRQLQITGAGIQTTRLDLSYGGTNIITAPSSGVTQLGTVDAASPAAQTLQAQSVVAGNANTAGATFTIAGSKSNGSGGGDVVFQTTLSNAASGTQNTLATALTLKGGTQAAVFANTISATLSNVATTSAVCYNTGTGLFTYDGTLGTCNVSTMRVKHDIVPLKSDILLAGVMKMQPDSFFYNANMNTPGQQLGLMAEDLEKIDPRLVSYDDTGKPNAIRYLGPMFAYLTGAIKAQQAEINALKQRLP